MRPLMRGLALGAILIAWWCSDAGASANPAPAAAGLAPFFARLRAHGRAEVRLEIRAADEGGASAGGIGRLVLEPPDRARLEFERTGERVTLRSDGGEWLQPRLRQWVKLGPARALAALEWWDLLLGRDRGAFREHAMDDRHVLIVRGSPERSGDSAWVTLDPHGLPSRIEIHAAGATGESYRLARWKFLAPRGRADFVLAAPPGYEIVDLP